MNPKSTSNQSSKPCTVLQYPSTKANPVQCCSTYQQKQSAREVSLVRAYQKYQDVWEKNIHMCSRMTSRTWSFKRLSLVQHAPYRYATCRIHKTVTWSFIRPWLGQISFDSAGTKNPKHRGTNEFTPVFSKISWYKFTVGFIPFYPRIVHRLRIHSSIQKKGPFQIQKKYLTL